MGNTIYKPSPNSAVRTTQLRLLQKEFNDAMGYIVLGSSHVCIVPVKVTDVRFLEQRSAFYLWVNCTNLHGVTYGLGMSIEFHDFFTSLVKAEEHAVLRKIRGSES